MTPTPSLLGRVSPLNRAVVERDRFGGRVTLYLAGVTPIGPSGEVSPDEAVPDFYSISGSIVPREPNQTPQPAAFLDEATAQGLADSLWAAGFRPTESIGSTGQLAATEAHLATVKGILDQALPLAFRRAGE